MMVEEELARISLVGDDGSALTAIEFRLVDIIETPKGMRRRIGVRRWRLDTGEPLVMVDGDTFMVEETGEWLRGR